MLAKEGAATGTVMALSTPDSVLCLQGRNHANGDEDTRSIEDENVAVSIAAVAASFYGTGSAGEAVASSSFNDENDNTVRVGEQGDVVEPFNNGDANNDDDAPPSIRIPSDNAPQQQQQRNQNQQQQHGFSPLQFANSNSNAISSLLANRLPPQPTDRKSVV